MPSTLWFWLLLSGVFTFGYVLRGVLDDRVERRARIEQRLRELAAIERQWERS